MRSRNKAWTILRVLPGLAVLLFGCGDNEQPTKPLIVVLSDASSVSKCDGAICFDSVDDAIGCGDGVVSSPEEGCDDANLLSGDGCSEICQREICGNGILDPGEACDPPGVAECSDTCRLAIQTCGNKQIEVSSGEQCDDGNAIRGDGCRNCSFECGDGFLDREHGEECEPAYTPRDENGLSTTCTPGCRRKPFCGDGKVDQSAGEQCDPVNGSTCVDNCRIAASQGPNDACKPIVGDAGVSMPTLENLVPNGAFDTDTAGWTRGPTVDVQFAMGQGAAKPGSARVSFKASLSASTFSVDGIQRCVTISAGDTYAFEASYLNSIGQPAGTRAFAVVLLYPTTDCSGTPAPAGPGAPPTSPQAGKWLPYKLNIDANSIGSPGAVASVSIKLGVIVAPGQTGMAFWDDATLRSGSFNPNCGNCVIDTGETCDDGNRIRSDGCSAICRIEGAECGNRKVDVGETCDTGSTTFSGPSACTPLCMSRSSCDDCSLVNCRSQFTAGLELPGVATSGPGKGVARNVLAGRLRQCIQRSGCAGDTAISSREGLGGKGAFIENCYCGTAGKECLIPGLANGSCLHEVEAALETREVATIVARLGGAIPEYPSFAAVRDLTVCEKTSCPAQCTTELTCGNGIIQERTTSFADTYLLPIGRKQEKCTDALTPTGAGCSFEECDGSAMCDKDCFLLQCGNKLLQQGEDCDDGNTKSLDGCDANCKAEFVCGDNKVATDFGEQCDPPNTGKNCSMTEFMSTPTDCGCGSTCEYKVCGNNVLQDGEQCDPPNGTTCGPDCKVAGLGECVECMLLAKDDIEPYRTFLQGNKDVAGFEKGCIDIKECFDLLNCHINNHCFMNRRTISSGISIDCYCGIDPFTQEASVCEAPDFVPKGRCATEYQKAHEVQHGNKPLNAEAVGKFFDWNADLGRPPARFAAEGAMNSAVGAKADFPLSDHLKAAGVDDTKIESCMNACFGPK
jgi:cysteine-rich repeat protein